MDSRFFVATERHESVSIKLVDPRLYSPLLTESLATDLWSLLEKCRQETVEVDLEGVTIFPTTTINCLVQLQKQLRNAHRELVLCGVNETVRAKLRSLNLEGTVFHVLDESSA